MAPSAIAPSEPVVITSNGSTLGLYSSSPDSDVAAPAVQAPAVGYRGYHHITWWVGNAKQAASYYITRMGFKAVAKRDLSTGCRHIASHVVQNGNVRLVFTSPLLASEPYGKRLDKNRLSAEDQALLEEMHEHQEKHGDAVKDVAFEVDDVQAVYATAVQRGAKVVYEPKVLSDESTGDVAVASVRTYGDTTHTFIQNQGYSGPFLPGYQAVAYIDPTEHYLPTCTLDVVDHCVGNQDWDQMEDACDLSVV